MNFKTAIETCLFKKYKDFNSRASRSEYWYFYLFYTLVVITLTALTTVLPETIAFILQAVIYIYFVLPSISVGVRRLHDTNKSGWLLLLGLIPIINLVLIYFFVLKSNEGGNKYGFLDK